MQRHLHESAPPGNGASSIQSMLADLKFRFAKVETKLASGLSPVKVDPSQIDQVLMNLAVNARDAMPQGGKLILTTEERDLNETFCARHRNFHPGRQVILTIQDTGTGIPRDLIDKVFEPFFTTKDVGSGTGLGLATVLGIVEQNGGHIHVESEPDQGTTFTLYFPASNEAELPQPARDATGSKAPGSRGGETILVVEDDPLVQKVVVSLLSRLGYQVLLASGGTEALAISREHPGPIHLLFTDVVMPDTNGKKLATRLQARFPDMAVLYTSGYNRAIIAHHGVLEEGIEFIPKPYRLAELGEKVRSVLDESAARRQQTQRESS